MAQRSSPCWHPLQPDGWLKSRQGSLTILYNLFSADTHLLNDLTLEILDHLRQTPATLEALCQHMGISENAEEERATLARVLWELDHLGLIVPMAGDDPP